MLLNSKDKDKLLLHLAGELAAKRKARGVKLNYPESVAYIASGLMELARDGHSVASLMQRGRSLLAAEECMEGVPGMVREVQVEATFPDGTKLVTVHDPIQGGGANFAGELEAMGRDIALNAGRATLQVEVANTGDRPIQVGSHFPFAQANTELRFDREAARGFRLDIPSGTAVRFEPGETKTVELVALA